MLSATQPKTLLTLQIYQQTSYLMRPSMKLKRWNIPDNLDFKGKIVAIFLIRSRFLST